MLYVIHLSRNNICVLQCILYICILQDYNNKNKS